MNGAPLVGHIFMYGPPGSGKSRVGKILASWLDREFVDLDACIVSMAGRTISELVGAEGEGRFREIEKAALDQVVLTGARVISLGGGALLDPENRCLAEQQGEVVCLTADYATLLERILQASEVRPLLSGDPAGMLAQLLARRSPHYASFGLQQETTGRTPQQVAWETQIRLGLFHVRGMGAGYDVAMLEDGLEAAGEMLQKRGLNGPIALVSDENVSRLYSARVAGSLRRCGYRVSEISLPPGERHKTIESITALWSSFLSAGLERGSTVIALGGGVIGDLCGFAAATYLRGVSWVAMPTSLLAMVDAHLGGKTGFDLPQGKNLAGAFYPPRLVLVDRGVLATLPEVELRNGLTETIKHGVVGDEAIFRLCEGGWEAIRNDWSGLIRRAMAVKIKIIQTDPYEGKRRAALNYGHTLGHAIESASGYQLRHGEAVAIGMVGEARLAETIGLAKAGLADRIEQALVGVGLPVRLPREIEREAIIGAMRYDKKKQDGRVRFALPVRIGKVKTGILVDQWAMLQILTRL